VKVQVQAQLQATKKKIKNKIKFFFAFCVWMTEFRSATPLASGLVQRFKDFATDYPKILRGDDAFSTWNTELD